jgi:hypothetical protein
MKLQIRAYGDVKIWLQEVEEQIEDYKELRLTIYREGLPDSNSSRENEKRVQEFSEILDNEVDQNVELCQSLYNEFNKYGCNDIVQDNLRIEETNNMVAKGTCPYIYDENKPNTGLAKMIRKFKYYIDGMEKVEKGNHLYFTQYSSNPNWKRQKYGNANSIELPVQPAPSIATLQNQSLESDDRGVTVNSASITGSAAGNSVSDKKPCEYCTGLGRNANHASNRCYSNPLSPMYRQPGTTQGRGGGGRFQGRGSAGRHRGRGRSR